MEQTLLIIVIILIFILVLLIAAMTVIGLRFLKLKNEKEAPSEMKEETPKEHYKKISPEVMKSLRSNAKYQNQAAYCVDHENEISAGICSISGESYCEHCLTTFNNMKFSKKYLDVYLSSDWPEFQTIAEINANKDMIERVYKAKKELWQTRSLPIIVQGQ